MEWSRARRSLEERAWVIWVVEKARVRDVREGEGWRKRDIDAILLGENSWYVRNGSAVLIGGTLASLAGEVRDIGVDIKLGRVWATITRIKVIPT